jgi:hypothetical protein
MYLQLPRAPVLPPRPPCSLERMGTPATQMRLVKNYRSYPRILKVACLVLKGGEGGGEAGAIMESSKDSEGEPVRLVEYGTPEDEAAGRGLATVNSRATILCRVIGQGGRAQWVLM